MEPHRPSYRDRLVDEGQPPANRMDRWILALVVFCLFAGRAIYCVSGAGPFQACMQGGMPRVIGMALQAAVLILAIWVGPKIGRRFDSQVLGYASGVTIFLALSTLLLWLGILQP